MSGNQQPVINNARSVSDMSAVYKHDGETIDYTPVAPVEAGEVIALSAGYFGVAMNDIAADELGSLSVEGVFEFDKSNSAHTYDIGALAYWLDSAEGVTTSSSGNSLIGRAVKASGNGDETVWVKINI